MIWMSAMVIRMFIFSLERVNRSAIYFRVDLWVNNLKKERWRLILKCQQRPRTLNLRQSPRRVGWQRKSVIEIPYLQDWTWFYLFSRYRLFVRNWFIYEKIFSGCSSWLCVGGFNCQLYFLYWLPHIPIDRPKRVSWEWKLKHANIFIYRTKYFEFSTWFLIIIKWLLSADDAT